MAANTRGISDNDIYMEKNGEQEVKEPVIPQESKIPLERQVVEPAVVGENLAVEKEENTTNEKGNIMDNAVVVDDAIHMLSEEQRAYLRLQSYLMVKSKQIDVRDLPREQAVSKLSADINEYAANALKPLEELIDVEEARNVKYLNHYADSIRKHCSADENREALKYYKHMAVKAAIDMDTSSSNESKSLADKELYASLEKSYTPLCEGKTLFELSDVQKNFIYHTVLRNLEQRETGMFNENRHDGFNTFMRCLRSVRFLDEVAINKTVYSVNGYEPEFFYNDIREDFKERLSHLPKSVQEEFPKYCRCAADIAMNNDKWLDSARKLEEMHMGNMKYVKDAEKEEFNKQREAFQKQYIWEHITKYKDKEEEQEAEKKKQEEAKLWQTVFLNAEHIMQRMNCEKTKDNKTRFYGYYDDGKEVRRYNLGRKQDAFENLMQTAYHLTLQQVGKEKALPLDNELDRFDKNKESLDSYFRRQHDKYRKSISISKMAWNAFKESDSYSPVLNKKSVENFCNVLQEKSKELEETQSNALRNLNHKINKKRNDSIVQDFSGR